MENPFMAPLSRHWRCLPKLILIGFMLFAGNAPALAQQPGASRGDHAGKPAPSALPADVVSFIAGRDQCDHFRGEDPGDDEARAESLQSKLEQTCRGTDARLATLRRHYADNATVKAALAGYEKNVE
ncbi:hypothetical protein RBI14_08330 [Alcaligenaceae bacterium B3P038]|nr:hypothetical protein [Alcaligenaceae bacterium B3P038]